MPFVELPESENITQDDVKRVGMSEIARVAQAQGYEQGFLEGQQHARMKAAGVALVVVVVALFALALFPPL